VRNQGFVYLSDDRIQEFEQLSDCRDREKMSRRELLDIAIKYINFLNTVIQMQEDNEI
jgi:hypothetical protein